jgi:hypothetical protein
MTGTIIDRGPPHSRTRPRGLRLGRSGAPALGVRLPNDYRTHATQAMPGRCPYRDAVRLNDHEDGAARRTLPTSVSAGDKLANASRTELVVDVEDRHDVRQLLPVLGMLVGYYGGAESEKLDHVTAPAVVVLVQLDLDDA